jgi:hypothetical protein
MDKFELERRRNEWVAEQLGVKSVMRDDVEFFDKESDDGVTIAAILPVYGCEQLVPANSNAGIPVPDELKLGL